MRRTERVAVQETEQEIFLRDVYRRIDEAVTKGLEESAEQGARSTCRLGCSACCRQPIVSYSLEAHVMGQHIRREFSTASWQALKVRMASWFQLRAQRPTEEGVEHHSTYYNEGPFCPLLVDHVCSVYPVRPVICRAHYVSSPPASCLPRSHPEADAGEPQVLTAVHTNIAPMTEEIRAAMEATGMTFEKTVFLLPQTLALELDWEELWRDAISAE